jgi:Skp family chaperone for outer membrane proteins
MDVAPDVGTTTAIANFGPWLIAIIALGVAISAWWQSAPIPSTQREAEATEEGTDTLKNELAVKEEQLQALQERLEQLENELQALKATIPDELANLREDVEQAKREARKTASANRKPRAAVP